MIEHDRQCESYLEQGPRLPVRPCRCDERSAALARGYRDAMFKERVLSDADMQVIHDLLHPEGDDK